MTDQGLLSLIATMIAWGMSPQAIAGVGGIMAKKKPDSRFYQWQAGLFLATAVAFALWDAEGADVMSWVFVGAAALSVVFALRAKE